MNILPETLHLFFLVCVCKGGGGSPLSNPDSESLREAENRIHHTDISFHFHAMSIS